MVSPRLATLAGLLLAAPLTGLAQTTDPAPAPRFYVGLSAYNSFYQRLGSVYNNGFRLPVQVTAGYQLRPRLAVQLGVAYSGGTTNYAFEGYFFDFTPGAAPSYYRYSSTSTVRNVSVSALARYTLTRNLSHRLQFDALGGLGLEYAHAYTRDTKTDSLAGSLQTTSNIYRGSQTALLLSAGLGTRYRLSPRFELNFDFMAHYAVPTSRPATTVRGLTSSAALGLRYRFGK